MTSKIQLEDIISLLKIADINGFNGHYIELGGGEVNNTYRLDFADKQLILRVAKDAGQDTLQFEARALRLLNSPFVPKLVYFDEQSTIHGRAWILETFLQGATVERLNVDQFYALGQLLAEVHTVATGAVGVRLKEQFLYACRAFGDETYLSNHPDPDLQSLIRSAFAEFETLQPTYDKVTPTLVHSDATPSNILSSGKGVGLIDWEFSKFNDPMCDFSTVYYEDMEFNHGKWRIQISNEEKQSLFAGYLAGNGSLDESRIKFWIRFDKLGAVVFLYWRLHLSERETKKSEIDQYKLDYDNLVASLAS